jgi:nucleotide-binding universal stress UspA family protein
VATQVRVELEDDSLDASPADRPRHQPRAGWFGSVVVAVTPAVASERPVGTAALLAADRKATVLVVCVLEIPRELPLDALFPEEEREAWTLLRNAAAIVERHGIRAVPRLERATSAATAILELVESHGAGVVVIATERRVRSGRAVFGKTVRAVLNRAPCRVLLVTAPPTATV